jgi:hypothetical protein
MAEQAGLRSAFARVRALHTQYRTTWTDEFDVCAHCTRGMDLVRWPCATIRALDGGSTSNETPVSLEVAPERATGVGGGASG